MKTLKIIPVSCFFLVGLLLIMGVSTVMAIEYLGESCWKTQDGGIFELGWFTHMGDGHYLVTGKRVATGEETEAINGNAEVVNNKVYMTLTLSGGDENETWTFVGRAILNLPNLNGTLEIMGVTHNKLSPNPEEAHMDYDGPFTLTLVPCP